MDSRVCQIAWFFNGNNGNGMHISCSSIIANMSIQETMYDMNEEGDNCCDQSFLVVVTCRRQAHMQIILID